MPMYEYRCNECNHEFVLIVPVSFRDETQTCPACEGTDTERMVSAPANFGWDGATSGSSCGGGGGFT
jgi:putative FmdB family regulatory protein